MSLERVLVWPEAYPLLLKGLLEQNGAFILDALEAWPKCEETKDAQGISTSVLPPLYYLLWLKPAEPFEQCFYQHIFEYDDNAQQYIESAIAHLHQQLNSKEAISELLLSRIDQYAAIGNQVAMQSELTLTSLCMHLRFFKLFQQFLNLGMPLSHDDVLAIWADDDFREVALPFIKSNVTGDTNLLAEEIADRLRQGEDFFDLLLALSDGEVDNRLLERALLSHISQPDAKQSLCMRFIEQGAKGQITDEDGLTALIWSAKQGFANVFDALLSKERASECDLKGNNLLHFAVRARSLDIISKALNGGVNYHQKDSDGLTPYRLAVELELPEVIKHFEHKFGIKELSEEGQLKLIQHVHLLHALVCFILPLQIFLIFSDSITIKTEISIATTLVSLGAFAFALSLKRSNLYPNIKHPFALTLIRILSPISLILALLLLLVILTTVLS
ncbi:ankyrin repeat domain-containing protein [Pseudoalteromonas spongiae]|uniref:ankyrin repeat domain-containing protein n=1 Tax=Pseudoalteromonas spongiae TaxID=298657 RepID=UPI0037354F3F